VYEGGGGGYVSERLVRTVEETGVNVVVGS